MIPATHYIDHVYLFDGDKLLKELEVHREGR
jgi:hypothetical protein